MTFLQKVLRHFVDLAPTEFNFEIATKYVFFSNHFNLFLTLFHLVFWPSLILFFYFSKDFLNYIASFHGPVLHMIFPTQVTKK